MLKETLLTLWDLLRPAPAERPGAKRVQPQQAPGVPNRKHKPASIQAAKKPPVAALVQTQPASVGSPKPRRVTTGAAVKPAKASRAVESDSAQARYDQVVEMMLAKYNVRVRKWRKSMSGVAWYVTYRDGSISRLIESPKPKGPMSIAIFLHEIGHHAIGFNTYKPRCLEEYHAWAFSIRTMEELGLNVTDAVRDRMYRSLHYAIGKASRRGIKKLPAELEPFLKAPPPRRRRAA